MIVLILNCIFALSFPIAVVKSDLLEEERSSFFGFTHEVVLSTTTRELVSQLSDIVWTHMVGDRRVRRYYDKFDTPFVEDESPKETAQGQYK